MTETALEHALKHAKHWIAELDERPVAATTDVDTLRQRLSSPLPEVGTDATTVVDDLVDATRGGHLGSTSGRFFAWVIGGGLESALAADWLVSTWDQNATLSACGPAVSMVEEVAGEWLKDLLDLPRNASFAFTTGCQLAHFTGLAAARHAILARADWDVEERGLVGAPSLHVITNEEKHDSVDLAVRYLGLGSQSIIRAETTSEGKITATGLTQALEKADGRAMVVLNAADLNVGACDSFAELIPIAHDAGAWVHVDGAFGLFARASRSKRYLVEGIDLADSWATDGHKWLNVPFDCGMAIVRDNTAHRAAMTISADYLAAATDARDQIDWTPEWSRRARGVPVYAALRELGRDGVEQLIDRCCDYCLQLVTKIGELSQAEVVSEPALNQGLVRFVKPGASPEENDQFTDQVVDAINATGEAFFSGTTRRGRRAMRVSVVNWRTSQEDVDRTIAAVSSVLK